MRYFRYQTDQPQVNLYPIVCWHIGAPQASLPFIKTHIKRIAEDPYARWVYMGDGGECVTKSSKGSIYEQTMNPQDQYNMLVELLDPIREKGLFGITGNHDRRIFKDSGMRFAETLMRELKIPYLGNCVFWKLHVRRSTYDIFMHHGIDSSSVIGGKVNKAKSFDQWVFADAIFTAHSHICLEIPPKLTAYLLPSGAEPDHMIQWQPTYEYVCGCAYDSRVPGYAEEKGYQPITPAHLMVEFGGQYKRGVAQHSQTCHIWREL